MRIVMPKIKTHKGAKKRFKTTGKGKFRRRRSHSLHLFTNKTAKRKRSLRKSAAVHGTDVKRLKRLMPYG